MSQPVEEFSWRFRDDGPCLELVDQLALDDNAFVFPF